MSDMIYALEERIGEPRLFCGRKREMELLLNWVSKIPKKLSKSRALLGRRKSGKTAIMQRLFNILWNRDSNVIPFYFEVQDQNRWLLHFSEDYFRTFLSQYLSFLTRTPLPLNNVPWKWNLLEDMAREVNNRHILDQIETFREYSEKENEHQAMILAFGAPSWFAGYDRKFFVVMIDEIQYMTEYIYYDKARSVQAVNLPGAFHGLSELKFAPMLVSGSYVGWMTRMMRKMFVGGRLKQTSVSSKLMFSEGMEAISRYAEYHGMPVTEKSALAINLLTQSDPFYISVLFGSEFPEKNLSDPDGVIKTLAYEVTDRRGEFFITWSEYIDTTLKQVNDVHGKKILLYLSKERHKECTRDEIRDHLGWEPAKDRELEEKLRTLEYGDLIMRGGTDFHYRGIPDDILDLIFRERYQYEIENVRPDAGSEFAARIAVLEGEKKSLEGTVRELRGRMLELIVSRELNRCRKKNRPVPDFAERMRKIPDPAHRDRLEKLAELCGRSRFDMVWMNHYLQMSGMIPAEADVFATGEDSGTCRALVFEIKNRDEKYRPTANEAALFLTKAGMVRQILEQEGKEVQFVCPVYLSAKGFSDKIEAWLHSNGILTADAETWLTE